MKWVMEINDGSFIRTYPEPVMTGGGVYVRTQDRSISFLTTFMEDERERVVGTARRVMNFLNGENQPLQKTDK